MKNTNWKEKEGRSFEQLQDIIYSLGELKSSETFGSEGKITLCSLNDFDWFVSNSLFDEDFDEKQISFTDNARLVSCVPKKYWIREDKFVGHHDDKFYEVSLGDKGTITIKRIASVGNEIPVFDFDGTGKQDFLEELYPAIVLLQKAYRKYVRSADYWRNRSKYIKTEEVEVERPNSAYSAGYSMSKDEENAMNEWKNKHDKKVHDGKYTYVGVTPVSRYSVKYQQTGLGMSCVCTCEDCYKEYAKVVDDGKVPYEAKRKLYDKATFTIKELG